MTRARLLLLAGLLLTAPTLPAQQRAEEPKAPTQVAFEKGEELYAAGKFAEALAVFSEFEPGRKHSLSLLAPRAIYFAGWCLVGLNRTSDALAKFQLIVDKFADRDVAAEAMLKIAECHRDLKQMPKALETYRAFQKKFPQSSLLPQAYLGEAWVLYRQGELAPAKNIAGRVFREFGNNASARLDSLFLLGQIFTDEKNFEEARKVYEELKRLRNNPRVSAALYLAADSLYNNAEKLKAGGQSQAAYQQYDDAIQYFERVVSRDSLVADIQKQIRDLRSRIPRASREQREAIQARVEELQRLATDVGRQEDYRPLALFRIANAYQSTDRPEEASLVYQHFLRLYRQSHKELAAQAHFGLIQTLNLRGQAEKAKQATDEFEKQFPDVKGKDIVLYAKFLKGDSEFKTQQFEAALASFQDFLKTSTNAELNQTAEFYIAACHFGLEKFDAARDAFAAFLQKHPQSSLLPDAQFRLGRCYFELSRSDRGADKETRRSNLAKAAELYETVRAANKKPELLAELTFQLGYLYAFLGEFEPAAYEKSAAAFRTYAEKWPDEPLAAEALYQLAQSVNAVKKHDDAIAALQQLVAKYPADKLAPWAAYGIGAAHAAANRPDDMITALRAFIAQFPTHEKVGEAYYTIGQNYENRGKSPEAIAAYQQLVDFAAQAGEKTDALLNPATAAQIQLANLLVKGRRFDDAVSACLEFLRKFSNQPVAIRAIITQLAAMYRGNKQVDQGQAKLTELAAQYQQNSDVRITVGTALIDLATAKGDLQAAYAVALKLKVDPAQDKLTALSYIAMGNTFLKTGHPADARDAFQKMLAAFPNDERNTPVALTGLGTALLKLNQTAEAETQFRKVLAEHPRHAAVQGAHLGLGQIAEARDQLEDAVRAYDAAGARSARNETEQEAAFRLGKLLHLKKNDPKAALTMYGRLLLTNNPLAEEAVFRSAQCHKALCLGGERSACEVARRSFQSYLARFKTNGRFLTEAQQELDALPPPPPAPGR